jgi:hypothetical protein
MMTYFYKYPGTQIEYLDGKMYDINQSSEDELMLADGWSLSPEEAEALTAKKPMKKEK